MDLVYSALTKEVSNVFWIEPSTGQDLNLITIALLDFLEYQSAFWCR